MIASVAAHARFGNQAEKRDLSDAVAYGTLTLNLSAPATVDDTAGAGGPAGFGGGLAAGWRSFLVVGGMLLTVLGFLLPFLAALVPVGAGIAWSRRRRGLPVWRPRRKGARPMRRVEPPTPPEPGQF